jgi:hypothetical protein
MAATSCGPGGRLLLLGARLVLAIGLPIAHYVGTFAPGSAFDTAARVVFGSLIEPPDMAYATPIVAFLVGLFLTNPSETTALSTDVAAGLARAHG